ncbi:peptidoglycan DD-metalloendopeptidase family protein [Streptomyces sp. NPDC054904]
MTKLLLTLLLTLTPLALTPGFHPVLPPLAAGVHPLPAPRAPTPETAAATTTGALGPGDRPALLPQPLSAYVRRLPAARAPAPPEHSSRSTRTGAATPAGSGPPRPPGAHGPSPGGRPLPAPLAVARWWDPPPTPYVAGHRGVDLSAPVGAELRAVGPGRVHHAGPVAGRGVLSLTLPGGLRTTYEPVRPLVAEGETVEAGQVVAVLAAGSHCATPCLHWGLLAGEDLYRNPLTLLPRPTPRLLPTAQGPTTPDDTLPAAPRTASAAGSGGHLGADGGSAFSLSGTDRHGFAMTTRTADRWSGLRARTALPTAGPGTRPRTPGGSRPRSTRRTGPGSRPRRAGAAALRTGPGLSRPVHA